MSDFYTLLKQISPTAPPLDRISLNEEILKSLPGFALPTSATTLAVSAETPGNTIALVVDSTGWMQKGMMLKIGAEVDEAFRGFFAEVVSIEDAYNVNVKIRELSNMIPTEIVPIGAIVQIGAVNGVRTAAVESSLDFWYRLKSGGSWSPGDTTATITARFWVSDMEVATRTISVKFTNGLLTTTDSGVENGIGVTILRQGGNIFKVRFTYQDSEGSLALNTVEKTIAALDFSIADGEIGLTGVPGYATVYGAYDANFYHPADAGYQSVVKSGNSWYVTTDPSVELAYGPGEGPPTDDSAGNANWTKIPNYSNVATGLTANAQINLSPNKSHYFKVTDKQVEASGILTPQQGSVLRSRFVDSELAVPTPYPLPGTFDDVDIVIPSPSTGARIYHTVDGTEATNAKPLWNPNFLAETNDFDDATWVKTDGTLTADATLAPDPSKTTHLGVGGTTRLEFYQDLLQANAGGFIAKGSYWTGSMYVKATSADITEVSIGIETRNGVNYVGGSWKTFQISSTEWTRINVTHKVLANTTGLDRLRLKVLCHESDNVLGEGLFVAMAQLEYGLYFSPYQENDATRKGILAMPATATTTFRAIAEKFGETSFEFNGDYVVTAGGGGDKTSTPYAVPVPGPYAAEEYPLSVEIKCATSGATIYYTTDGSDPTTGSTVYSGPIALADYGTIKALATSAGRPDSDIMVATYTQPDGQINQVETPEADPVPGYYDVLDFPISVTLTCPTAGATIYYTTNGSDPTIYSTQYVAPFNVSDGDVVRAIAVRDGWDDSEELVALYESV